MALQNKNSFNTSLRSRIGIQDSFLVPNTAIVRADEAINQFLDAKRAKGISDHTVSDYTYLFRKFAAQNPELPMQAAPIERFLVQVPNQVTRETYFKKLKTLYAWLFRRGVIPFNPMVDIERPKMKRKIARAFTTEELQAIFKYPHPPEMKTLLYLLTYTGLRLGEALSITRREQFRDITVDGETYCIVAVTGKTGDHEVPVPLAVKNMILFCLPWPWKSSETASVMVRRALADAGITGKRSSAHTLRHTFAREWTGDIDTLVGILGHTSPRMVLQVYRPFNLKKAAKEHQRFDPLKATGTNRQLPLSV